MVKRAAFTFIELIFAIVIIAISVMSLPLMIGVSSDGIEKNLVQEAIFAASAQLNQAIVASWDTRSLEDGGVVSLARVIDDGNCENNSSNPRYRHKPGHILQPLHRRCLDSNSTVISGSASGMGTLEDFTGSQTLVNATPSQVGYKDAYTTQITVTQNADFNGTSSNIKMIQANISDASGNLLTSLRAYSANIGEPDYYKREF